MKTNQFLIIAVISLLSLSAFAQLKVSSTGKVGIGIDPDASYNLCLYNAIFKTGSDYPSLIIAGDPLNYGKAMYPSVNNSCKLGLSNKAFNGIWTYGLTNLSDGRQKENIQEINNALETIMKLKGVKYDIKEEYSYIPKELKNANAIAKLQAARKNKLGFIAQDVNTILPEVVQHDDSVDIYGINYTEIIPVLVEAIKEQQKKIEELENCCTANLKSASLATGISTSLAENVAQLDQNIPNPFSRETKIGCFIPEESGASVLYIYNMIGTQLQQYFVSGKGKQTVTINGNSFEPGMYLYALVIDGKEVDTKRMILTK